MNKIIPNKNLKDFLGTFEYILKESVSYDTNRIVALTNNTNDPYCMYTEYTYPYYIIIYEIELKTSNKISFMDYETAIKEFRRII